MAPSLQGQPHTQPQARLLLPEPMNYYREISFLSAPPHRGSCSLHFRFPLTFSPSLLLWTLRQLEIPSVQPPPFQHDLEEPNRA